MDFYSLATLFYVNSSFWKDEDLVILLEKNKLTQIEIDKLKEEKINYEGGKVND